MQSVGTRDAGPESRNLPGRPDIVLPGRRLAIFVHGCFWESHGCDKGRAAKSKLHYWCPKPLSGFEHAGFDVVAVVEVDLVHCAVHKFNFPECTVIPRSVVGLSAAKIRLAAASATAHQLRVRRSALAGPSMIGQRLLTICATAWCWHSLRIVASWTRDLGQVQRLFQLKTLSRSE